MLRVCQKVSLSHARASLLERCNCFGMANIKKTVTGSIQAPSKIIVDPGYFRKTDLISVVINKFKNSNCLGDAKRNF